METLNKVRNFHAIFLRPINDKPFVTYDILNELRVRLLREEVTELEEALGKRNKVEVLDALSDIQYILDGSYLSLGFHKAKLHAFNIVHAANMAKMGPDGKPNIRSDGKILKPPGWTPPDLTETVKILESINEG